MFPNSYYGNYFGDSYFDPGIVSPTTPVVDNSVAVGIMHIGTRFRRWWNPPTNTGQAVEARRKRRRREEELLALRSGILP